MRQDGRPAHASSKVGAAPIIGSDSILGSQPGSWWNPSSAHREPAPVPEAKRPIDYPLAYRSLAGGFGLS